MFGGQMGYIYEIIVFCMYYICIQIEFLVRIVGFSVFFVNVCDVGEWIDVKKYDIYNFSFYVRFVFLEFYIQLYIIFYFLFLMLVMVKLIYLVVIQMLFDQLVFIFVFSCK